ncbi:hypothetical protein AX16_007724 [Volvariella volvacea WC 439]|nr:hypothetical protein AX16_007724 [Volvariella volvacea WC 439]
MNAAAKKLLHALVVVNAMHAGEVRADLFRCDPNTRQAIIDDITSWIEDILRQQNILWLSDPAGIGKSALCMSTAERLDRDGSTATVAGSFFFFKGDPQRNSPLRLIPRLAYQLAVRFEEVGRKINKVVARDPKVLEAKLEVQWRKLIVEPVKAIPNLPPAAIIIDGLDECGSAKDQRRILRLVSSCDSDFPLAFLLASRPESHIAGCFGAEPLLILCRPRIDLAQCKDTQEMWLRFSEVFSRHKSILQYRAVNAV